MIAGQSGAALGETGGLDSANLFYGEYGEYGVSRTSMSNPGKPGFSFCFSIQVSLMYYAVPVSSVFVCYPPYCFCNFPFPRMGCSLVGGKGKSCRREILCYGIKGWIRQPVDENRGSIISIRVLIFARSWTSWRDASATVLCQKTVQLSRQRDAESAKWVMTSHF